MRTIIFRGKDRFGEIWFYGNLVVNEMFGHTHIWDASLGYMEVDPKTVGQFTGLYDCDGKKIYEGDILRLGNSPSGVCEVKWNESLAAFCIQFFFENKVGTRPLGGWVICQRKVEVIGNIFDNPELLKGGENEQDIQ